MGMKAALLVEPKRLEIREIPMTGPGDRDVVVKIDAVGICGSDVHIYAGEINWNIDAEGNVISLETSPQILGHEITGRITRVGSKVHDVFVGDLIG